MTSLTELTVQVLIARMARKDMTLDEIRSEAADIRDIINEIEPIEEQCSRTYVMDKTKMNNMLMALGEMLQQGGNSSVSAIKSTQSKRDTNSKMGKMMVALEEMMQKDEKYSHYFEKPANHSSITKQAKPKIKTAKSKKHL